MPLLQWKPQYSVGIDAVDHEHQELIELINQLYDQLAGGSEKVRVEAFFGDLFKGISAHFALEERFMRERSYDQLTQHKTDHERLLDEIRDIMDDFADEQVLDATTLATRLEAWFARHFETHDARLHKKLGAHPH
jgi:hemerythrin